MALSKSESKKEVSNLACIARILLGPCTDTLRDVLTHRIYPSVFKEEIRYICAKAYGSKELFISLELLIYQYDASYSDFDIPLLYFFLLQDYHIHFPRPKLWHFSSEEDRSLFANIRRIYKMHKKYKYYQGDFLKDSAFEQDWEELFQTVKELEKYIGSATANQDAMKKIKNSSMDPDVEHLFISNLVVGESKRGFQHGMPPFPYSLTYNARMLTSKKEAQVYASRSIEAYLESFGESSLHLEEALANPGGFIDISHKGSIQKTSTAVDEGSGIMEELYIDQTKIMETGDIPFKKYEEISSETLKEAFNSFKLDFPADVPGRESFARAILEDDINRLVAAIQSLSRGIVLTTQINAIKRDTPQVEACVFEVDVVYDEDEDEDEDQFCVLRKETSLSMLLEMEEDTRIRVILIRSKSLPVVLSKLIVYKNFKHVINEKGFFLQHEYEEIDDVAKMIAYRVISSFCSSVESLINAFTADLRRSMADYFDKQLTAVKIRKICLEVLEKTGYKPFGSTKSTRNWSSEIAEFIQLKLSNETLKGADAWSEIKSTCCKTVEDLKIILNGLDKFQANELQIDQKKEIEEWHKREVIRNKSLLREYPSIIKYIAGHKDDGREVVKVFLSEDDEEAKQFVRKECRSVLKDIEFDFVNVENTEETSETNKKMGVLDEEIASFDNSDRLRLKQTIQEIEEKLYARYSNIIGIEIGNVKRFDSPMQEGLGVVLYCLDKTLIPFGEKPLPTYIAEWPCEVLEDLFMLGKCPNTCSNHPDPGCSIGIPSDKFFGSCGFLYESKSKDNKYKSGFFTASHVAIKDFHKLYLATQPLSSHSLGSKDHFIVHPSYLENNKSNNQVGQVVESFCGNYGDPPIGMDVAVVKDVSPRTKEIETLEIVKKSNLDYRTPIEVMKTGRKTDTTFGYLIDPKKHEILSARLDSIRHSNRHYVFKMPYVVKDKDESKRFFLRGDSGSGVFLLGETGLPEKALGIAFGYLYQRPYTFVCNIEDILEKLGLKLVRYRDNVDVWGWSPKD